MRLDTKQRTSLQRPTLKTIAQLAGLGVTTVSRALNDGDEIAEQTKLRVRKIAEDIGYQPNRAGVRLRTGKTMVVSLVLHPHDEVVGYGSSLILGISQTLQGSGYHLLVTPDFLQTDELLPIRYLVENRSADALILSRIRPQDIRVRYLLEHNIPFVTHGRTELATPHAWHDFDNHEFAYKAANRLLEKGCRRLMMIKPPSEMTFYTHMVTGFQRALQRHGLEPVAPPAGLDLNTPPQQARDAIAAVAKTSGTDGYIVGGDAAALSVIAGCTDAGLTLGQDYALIAKQTSSILDNYVPAIDTLYEDLTATGATLAEQALKLLSGTAVTQLQALRAPVKRYRTPHKDEEL